MSATDTAPSPNRETELVRVAVVQMDYHPALFADLRSPLEDPGGMSPLLPATTDIPFEMRTRFASLRERVREAYCRQLLHRLTTILETCESWGVKVVVFPEYSVPWDILGPVARAARSVVVVAGTHRVEREGLEQSVYSRLGCPPEDMPLPGQAVAPVLHGGKLLALIPKMHAASAANEELEPGGRWHPVQMPEGFPGPMGVLICLDFLHRENPTFQQQVAGKLAECRFLAVPSWTAPHTIAEFRAKAWEEARRYGRPVLYADHASGGGTALFVDEEKHSDLLPYPKKPGCFYPHEEGVIVADVDMGFERPGGSRRYDQQRPVRPQAAATFAYMARPLEAAYASWLIGLRDEPSSDERAQLTSDLAQLEKHQPLLDQVRANASTTRRDRLDRLLEGRRLITSTETFEQLVCEQLMAPAILPPDVLRTAHVIACQQAIVRWIPKCPALSRAAAPLLEMASKLGPSTPKLTDEGLASFERQQSVVRRMALRDIEPSSYFGQNLVMDNGLMLSVRRHARDMVLRLPRSLMPRFPGHRVYDSLPHSVHSVPEGASDVVTASVPFHSAGLSVSLWELLAAEGSEPAAAVAIGAGAHVYFDDWTPVKKRAPGEHLATRMYLLVRRGNGWRLVTRSPIIRTSRTGAESPEEWDERHERFDPSMREPILLAFEELGIDVDDIEEVDDDAFDRRLRVVLAPFEGARRTVHALRERRLARVDGHFVEPSLAQNRFVMDDDQGRMAEVVEPALQVLSRWLENSDDASGGTRQALLVLGEYGSGKSTLLAEWARCLWDRDSKWWRPILVDLAGTSSAPPEALLLNAACITDTPAHRAALRLGIRCGRLLPIFDGFDEMATRVSIADLPQRLADILDTAQEVSRIVLSSRDHYFPTEGELNSALERALSASLKGPWNCVRVTLRFFSEEQILALLRATTGGQGVSALWGRVRATYDLGELCRRPLLLGMIIAAREELLGRDPLRRADVYDACLRAWLDQASGPDAEIFSQDKKRRVAEAVAMEIWRTGEAGVFVEDLRRLLHSLFPASFFDAYPRTAEVLESTGGMFFVRRPAESGDCLLFAHTSFLEYFLACALLRAGETSGDTLASTLATGPVKVEVVDFLSELLSLDGPPADTAFVVHLQAWLVARGKEGASSAERTATAAANAVRVLLHLARLHGNARGWIPENAGLQGIELPGENLASVRLSGARLEQANLSGANLDSADLTAAILDGARLRGARLDHAVLDRATAKRADFTLVEAEGASLIAADLRGAALRQSMWLCCNWEGTALGQIDSLAWFAPGSVGLRDGAGAIRALSREHLRPVLGDGRTPWDGQLLSADWRPDVGRMVAITEHGRWLEYDPDTGRALTFTSERAHRRTTWASRTPAAVFVDESDQARFRRETTAEADGILRGPTDKIAVAADATLVALSNGEGVQVLDVSAGEVIDTLSLPSAAIDQMAFSRDGCRLALLMLDTVCWIWQFRGPAGPRLWELPRPVRALAWSPREDLLATTGVDFFLRFWSVPRGVEAHCLLTTERTFSMLRFAPLGIRLAGLDSVGRAHLWDVEQRRSIRVLDPVSTERPTTITWSPDAGRIATVGPDIRIHEVATGRLLSELPRGAPPSVILWRGSVSWSASAARLRCHVPGLGAPLLIDCVTGRISLLSPSSSTDHDDVWEETEPDDPDILSQTERTTVEHAHSAVVIDARLSNDRSRLASVDTAGNIRLWAFSPPSLLLSISVGGGVVLAHTPGGYCQRLAGNWRECHLAFAANPSSPVQRLIPLGGLRAILERPERVAAAARGDLGADGAAAELAHLVDVET